MTKNGEFYGLHYYEEILVAKEQFEKDLNEYLQTIDDTDDLKPVVYVTSRIKDPDSLKEKLRVRGLEETYEAAMEGGIHDIIGFRIICAFTDDVYNVFHYFEQRSKYSVELVKDYIKEPKENGYRSLHVILTITLDNGIHIPLELQIRTIAQDAWATLEHKLKYKKELGTNTTLLEKELKRCATLAATLDCDMSAMKDMLRET